MQPGSNLLYESIAVGIALLIGFLLVMKAGNKIGWLFVAAACVYGYVALGPQIKQIGAQKAGKPANPGASSNYYKAP